MKPTIYFRWNDSRRPPMPDDRAQAARIIASHRRARQADAICVYDRATRTTTVGTKGYDVRGIFSHAP